MRKRERAKIKIYNMAKTISGWAAYLGRYSSGLYNYRSRNGHEALVEYIKKMVGKKRAGKLPGHTSTKYRGKTFSDWERKLGLTPNYLYSIAYSKSRAQAHKIIDGLHSGNLEIRVTPRGKRITKKTS